jgi:8-oxo-dGTP diphosphatase
MANREIRVVAAVIEREGKYLITQRREEAVLPMLWEFPGGRVNEGETDETALKREIRERVGVDVEVGDRVAERHHAYDGYEVTLCLFACKLPREADPMPVRVREVKWVGSGEFSSYPFPPADQKTMDQLLGVKRWEPK